MLNFLALLMQADSNVTVPTVSPVMSTGTTVVALVILVVVIAAMWKVFVKAGEPGWAAIVPIYNMIVLLKIAGKPLWWIILLFIPFVNFIIVILVYFALAKNFGKGAGFALGMVFLPFIFFPLLAWGDARYQGVVA
ncbi:MAG: DUF5684 domain-containing protein [Thermoanaerobaculia bacterium]